MNFSFTPNEIDIWKKASIELNFLIEAPFKVQNSEGKWENLIFLPQFGNSHGILLVPTRPPDFQTDSTIVESAKLNGWSYSFLNIELYSSYNQSFFKETLIDWGFFDENEKRPKWLNSPT
jgi:hypothetical protein